MLVHHEDQLHERLAHFDAAQRPSLTWNHDGANDLPGFKLWTGHREVGQLFLEKAQKHPGAKGWTDAIAFLPRIGERRMDAIETAFVVRNFFSSRNYPVAFIPMKGTIYALPQHSVAQEELILAYTLQQGKHGYIDLRDDARRGTGNFAPMRQYQIGSDGHVWWQDIRTASTRPSHAGHNAHVIKAALQIA